MNTTSSSGAAGDVRTLLRLEGLALCAAAVALYAHSGASRVDVELRYAQDLDLRIRDNGIGIDPAVIERGKKGHFGLQGMRERAARIGAKLTLGSNGASGTEIKLVVPGGIVFKTVRSERTSALSRFRKLLARVDFKI